MIFYIVMCQSVVFSVNFIQILFITQVSAHKGESSTASSWFSKLEKKLNDVMHEVIQGAKADQLTMAPEEKKRLSQMVDENMFDIMFTKPLVPRRIQAITEKLTTNADNFGSEISEEIIEPHLIVLTEENTTHHSHRKKKTTKKERKKKSDKPGTTRWHRIVSKRGPKRKIKKNTSKKKPKIKIVSTSEHDDDPVTIGKPVDIVVHIKMAE